MRIIGAIIGIIVAAWGGVIVYRALYLEPAATVVITDTDVSRLPNTFRLASGIALLVIGALAAFLALRRRNSKKNYPGPPPQ